MTSFLICNNEATVRETYAKNYCINRGIDPLDITNISKEEISSTKKTKAPKLSLGVEDIKNMQRLVYLAPMRSLQKAVILQGAHSLTIEAQNALLKLLEEPPINTLMFLLSDSKDTLLPTIQSRCSIIELPELVVTLNEKDREVYDTYILLLEKNTVASALELAEKLGKTKEDAIKNLSALITHLRTKYIENTQIEKKHTPMYQLLSTLQDAYTRIKTTNINPRLTIEHALISKSA